MLTRSGKVCNDIVTVVALVAEAAASVAEPAPIKALRPVTRNLTEQWLVGQPSATLTGAKLPDCRQVLKYVLYLRQDPDNVIMKNEDIAYTVIDSVIVFWNMARIKVKYRQNCMFDLMAMWNE